MRLLVAISFLLASASAFVPHTRPLPAQGAHRRVSHVVAQPAQRNIQMGLFGLGVPEVAVILGIGGFILGPEKLTSLAKDFGKIAGELKDVPKEFAEGMKESEGSAAIKEEKEEETVTTTTK